MKRSTQLIVSAMVLLAASIRCATFWWAPDHPTNLRPARAAVVSALDSPLEPSLVPSKLVELGVSDIQFQRFDPQALVVIRQGADGQPGMAAIDDNGNGIVDDPSELGATGSDDVCTVASGDESSEGDSPRLVLQRGAMVASLQSGASRAIVLGNSSDRRPWTFLVELGDHLGSH